jgi:hypothetical protein
MVDISKLKKRMSVIAADGRRVGFISRMAGPEKIRLTCLSGSHGYDHVIPLAWVSAVDKYVYLNRPSRFVATNWEPVSAAPVRMVEPSSPVELALPTDAPAVSSPRRRPQAA